MTSVYYAGKPDAGLTRSSGLEEPGRKRVSAMRLRAALPSYTKHDEGKMICLYSKPNLDIPNR